MSEGTYVGEFDLQPGMQREYGELCEPKGCTYLFDLASSYKCGGLVFLEALDSCAVPREGVEVVYAETSNGEEDRYRECVVEDDEDEFLCAGFVL